MLCVQGEAGAFRGKIMIDWWNLQPTSLKRLRLFLGIVWRMHEGNRMTCALSWDVAKCLYPIKNRGQHALLV